MKIRDWNRVISGAFMCLGLALVAPPGTAVAQTEGEIAPYFRPDGRPVGPGWGGHGYDRGDWEWQRQQQWEAQQWSQRQHWQRQQWEAQQWRQQQQPQYYGGPVDQWGRPVRPPPPGWHVDPYTGRRERILN